MYHLITLEVSEAAELGNEGGVMPKERSPGEPATRRYSDEEATAMRRGCRGIWGGVGAVLGWPRAPTQRTDQHLVEIHPPSLRQNRCDSVRETGNRSSGTLMVRLRGLLRQLPWGRAS